MKTVSLMGAAVGVGDRCEGRGQGNRYRESAMVLPLVSSQVPELTKVHSAVALPTSQPTN